MKLNLLPLFFVLYSITLFGQNPNYAVANIPDSLKQNSNTIIRFFKSDITIDSQKSMTINTVRVVTILNELGLEDLDLVKHYDKNTKINKIEATVYDASGKEIKSYKRRDFSDQSAISGSTLYSDSRMLYLEYTPVLYPFTMVLKSEMETSNTAFIPSWRPIEGYFISVENASLTITYKPELKLKNKEVNFSKSFPVKKNETNAVISYTVSNLTAKKREELSPIYTEVFPMVYFALENFALENVEGSATNWSEFGKWYYSSLLEGTEELPQETISKVKQLIGDEKNPVKIAKIIYNYVQEKTRYVSIQVGIGGWKPMLAKDVDKLGYGDCKALTNYTRSLLKAVGVQSYYTVVWSGRATRDIQQDIASVQGDHVILTLPSDKDLIWLECTSQIQPFGFQGDFTDDRNVLLIKPEGGEIVKTKTFTESENLKVYKGSYQITEDGDLTGKVKIDSYGIEYDNEFQIERASREKQIKQLKEEFSNINNLDIKSLNFVNNKETIQFTEDLELQAEAYAQKLGENKFMFALNAFDQNSYIPKKYRSRQFPFQIERGYTSEDEIEINLPVGFTIEAKPLGVEQTTEFGIYKIDFIQVSPLKILCKRKLVIKRGFYDKSKYEEFRKFNEVIAKNDNSKIVIIKA